MKSIQTLLGILLLFFFTACQNGADKDKKTDTTKPAAPVATVAKPVYELVIWHKVKNFDTWMKNYEEGDSVRTANGVHSHLVGRDADDPNMVLVALMVDDVAKAKAFASSPDLKKNMEKAGVSNPTMMFVDRQMFDSTNSSTTYRLMVMHKVKDYNTWKKAFDGDKKVRMDAGLTDRALGYSVDDKNDVFLVFAVSDLKKAKEFISSKTLKDKMAEGGVTGAPVMHFYTVAKSWK